MSSAAAAAAAAARLTPFAMVGGGRGSWIGDVHRRGARVSGLSRLVGGVFSSTHAGGLAFAAEHLPGVDASRVYATVDELVKGERALPEADRAAFVVVCTPNPLHHRQCLALLEGGFHVVCDKPLTENVADAVELRDLAASRGLLLCLTHAYTGYAMVREARHLVRSGRVGRVRKVCVEYPQGWLEPPDAGGALSATSGISTLVDVGTHAEHLARYVTGLRVEELVADSSTFVGGLRAPDDFSVLLRLEGGARGHLVATQIHTGELNPLRIRVYGDAGGIDWCQETPDTLRLLERGRPAQTLARGAAYISPEAAFLDRLPPGHPTGLIDCFAALYDRVAGAAAALRAGERPREGLLDFPNADDGVESLRFVDAVNRSAASRGWERVER